MFVIIKLFLFVLLLPPCLYIWGSVISKSFQWNNGICYKFIEGLISLLAVFEVVATPFMLAKTSFDALYYTFLPVFCLITALGLIWCRKDISQELNSAFSKKRRISLLALASILTIALMVTLACLLQHTDDDDGFYVTIASTAVQQNAIFHFEQSTGLASVSFMTMYITTGIELLYAFFSKLCGIEPVVLIHTAMPILLIPFAFLTYLCLGRKMKLARQDTSIFILFVCLLNIFGNFSGYSQPSFLLLRIWQGKSIFVNILLPILYLFINIDSAEKDRRKNYAITAVIALACVCATNLSLYLLPVAYLLLYAIESVRKKDIKQLKHAAPALAVFAIYASITIFAIMQHPEQATDQISGPGSPFGVYKNFFGNVGSAVLYLAAIAYSAARGKHLQKLLSYASIVLLLTVLNPLVSSHLSEIPVYWRYFWLIPGTLLVSWMIVDILSQIRTLFIKVFVGVLTAACIIITGGCLYPTTEFTPTQNLYKLPNDVIEICNAIEKDKTSQQPVLMLPLDLSAKIRQYDTNLLVPLSRQTYTKFCYESTGTPEKYEEIMSLYNALYTDSASKPTQALRGLIHEFQIDYIIYPKYRDSDFLTAQGYRLVASSDQYNIFQ